MQQIQAAFMSMQRVSTVTAFLSHQAKCLAWTKTCSAWKSILLLLRGWDWLKKCIVAMQLGMSTTLNNMQCSHPSRFVWLCVLHVSFLANIIEVARLFCPVPDQALL